MICIDNDVFSRYASERSYPNINEALSNHREETWLLPSVVLFEFLRYYDAHNTIDAKRLVAEDSVDTIAEMDADVAAEAANLESRLKTAGVSLALADLLIAATARANGATLVTANKNDFDKTPIHQLMDVETVSVG
jgi:predicted nucleic acid-binding protein